MDKFLKVFFILVCLLQFGCINKKEEYHIVLENYNGDIIDEYDANSYDLFKDLDLSFQTNSKYYIFTGWNLKEKINNRYVYEPRYRIEDRIFKIEFDGNGGNLVDGKAIQYLKYGELPELPTFYKELCEFVGFDQEVIEVTCDSIYTATYSKLTINPIKPMTFINDVRGGFNFTNFIDDYDLLNGEIEQILCTLKSSGFNIIAFQINWLEHCDDNYNIDKEVLIKTKNAVDTALEYGFYVVLTSYDSYYHQWSSLNYYQYEKTINILNAIWSQIGEYFIEYDERLMFSCFNEPRDYITNSYSRESALILNLLNQHFIDLIRNQGYNNEYRLLLITPIWGDASNQNLQYFKIPNDEYLIISLHSYTPFGFVHDSTMDEMSWTDKKEEYQVELINTFSFIKEYFLDNDIAVLMTEYGSRDKHNTEERAKWLDFYISMSYNFGIKCLTWDSAIAHYDREYTFSIINKKTGEWKYPEFSEIFNRIYLEKKLIPFFDEIRNYTQMLSEEVIIVDEVTDMITNEKYSVEINYDKECFISEDGKLYAKKPGVYYFDFEVDGYTYYYQVNIMNDYMLYDCSFAMEIRLNDLNYLQCYIVTENKDIMRVEYDWYSSDESLLTINQYSTITILNDGIVGIIAVHKEKKEVGVLEVVIKNGTIVSYHNVFNEEDIYGKN